MAKLLVVDDDRDMCGVISDVLIEEGYKVNTAYDAKSALVKIKRERYDLMILDYNLSGLNGLSSGLTVLEEVRKLIPVLITIMISAFENQAIRVRANELGAYAFLDKPFNIDRLVRIVKKALKAQKRGCVNETDLRSGRTFPSNSYFGSSRLSCREANGR